MDANLLVVFQFTRSNAVSQFRMFSNVMESSCGKTEAAEGVGIYNGCNRKSLTAGRMTSDNLIFKRAAVWVYGKPKCHPTTSSGCNARIGCCTCYHGYFGAACEYQCPDGRYGRDCKDTCQCKNGALCSHINGSCTCAAGYRGRLCDSLCAPGYYGVGCQKCNCPTKTSACNPFTGQCACFAGYGGERCVQRCGVGKYENTWGPQCANNCTCVNGTCDPLTGKCTCDVGYAGQNCNNPCSELQPVV
ncbi:multiple epidermal growth factor-like domains protein 11 [Corticium candelabrum]|uniref:multiple epidermal growth factor-like domains protein 11 n=1 Tax=Corticium candelabrum TaxID=121492 RepID=UPI002E274DEE|nr:multiple epidermal growth factor-like domains protein 11 [Corticium candelabrum]XP_062523625.1 multiple epidermal growth factor-like domains protein 11 [Corticium candelabrum]